MNDPVQVETHLDDQQRLTPTSFIWADELYTVFQVGRRWQEGEWEHTLVMTSDGATWDLAFSPQSGSWRLMGRTAPRGPAVV
jgi:hypothetical protein